MDRERLRIRGAEPGARNNYEALLQSREEFISRGYQGEVVVDCTKREWEYTRQGIARYLLSPFKFPNTVLQDWFMFVHDIKTQSGKHTHQGGLVIYVLEGAGWSVVDGVRWDWQEGDLLLLPIKQGGVEHQHWNAKPGVSCKWLAFIHLPTWDLVSSELVQNEVSPDWQTMYGGSGGGGGETRGNTPVPEREAGLDQSVIAGGAPGGQATIYDQLIALRDHQRTELKENLVIRGDDMPWEINPHGQMKWLLHPFMPNQPLRSLIFYEQRIEPKSHSGRQLYQGGVIFYVRQGRGHTRIDGVVHAWKQGDVIQLPMRVHGVVFQHFNDSPDEPAILVSCEPNTIHSLNVDKGSGFEQLEVAPEYQAARKAR